MNKSFTARLSPGRTPAALNNVVIQADIDEETREALSLSAAGRLGSSPGSGQIGRWQQGLDEAPAEQVECAQ